MPKPRPKAAVFAFRVDERTAKRFRTAARKNKQTPSELLRALVADHLA